MTLYLDKKNSQFYEFKFEPAHSLCCHKGRAGSLFKRRLCLPNEYSGVERMTI